MQPPAKSLRLYQFPKLSADVEHGLSSEIHRFHHIRIRTNVFDEDERPVDEPEPFVNWSAGEEISQGLISALAWSPLGLAKHRRSALAVLTSQLILSVWSSSSDPTSEEHWERSLIINHTLQQHFGTSSELQSLASMPDKYKFLKKCQRVHTFIWSPPVRLSEHSPWSEHLILVANRNNDIVALRVQSSLDILSRSEKEWQATVVGQYHVNFEQSRDDLSAFTFEDHLQQQRCVANLALSPWTKISESTHRAYLAYTTRNAVVVRRVHLDLHHEGGFRVSFHDTVSKIPLDMPTATVIRWVPKETKLGVLYLVAHASSHLYCIEISIMENVARQQHNYKFDDKWSDISGKPIVTISSILSYAKSFRSNLQH